MIVNTHEKNDSNPNLVNEGGKGEPQGNVEIDDIMDLIRGLPADKTRDLFIQLKKYGKEQREEELNKKTDMMLSDLEKNHMEIEEDVVIMGYKGKKIHIEIPPHKNHEGLNFDFFVSNDDVEYDVFEKKPELRKKSYSVDNTKSIMNGINRHMADVQGDYDWNRNREFESEIVSIYGKNDSGDYLKKIAGLKDDRCYWMNNTRKGKTDIVGCKIDSCSVIESTIKPEHARAKLFINLQDQKML